MVARVYDHRHRGGGGLMAAILGVLGGAALGLAWMAWSGGWRASGPSHLRLDLEVPEAPSLPTPTPAPDPQPVPLPTPVAPPR